jgi:type II secretion system protein C
MRLCTATALMLFCFIPALHAQDRTANETNKAYGNCDSPSIEVVNANLISFLKQAKGRANYLLDDRVKGQISLSLNCFTHADSQEVIQEILAYKGYRLKLVEENTWAVLPASSTTHPSSGSSKPAPSLEAACNSKVGGPKTEIHLNLKGANLPDVIQGLSRVLKKNVLFDERISGEVSASLSASCSKNEEPRILEAVLAKRGYRIQAGQDKLWKIFPAVEPPSLPIPSIVADYQNKPRRGFSPQPHLVLVGTYTSGAGEAFAIIKDATRGAQRLMFTGFILSENQRLTAIFADRVELENNGAREVLSFSSEPEPSPGPSLAPDELPIPAAELKARSENPSKMLTTFRAVPYYKDGEVVGMRVFGVKPESLLGLLGLRNGDIVHAVNAARVYEITQMVDLLSKLKDKNSFSLSIARDGKEELVRYRVV